MQESITTNNQKQEYINNEGARKERLLQLFETLEAKERKLKKEENKDRKYERMFKGTAIVAKIHVTELLLLRANGQKLGYLVITPEISKLIQLEDHLHITIGFRGSHWRVIFMDCMASQLPFDLDS